MHRIKLTSVVNCHIVVAKPNNLPFIDGAFELVCVHNSENASYGLNSLGGLKRVTYPDAKLYIGADYNLKGSIKWLKIYKIIRECMKKLKDKGFSHSGSTYYYPSLNEASFVQFCSAGKNRFSINNLSCKKLQLVSPSQGHIFSKNKCQSEKLKSNYFLSRIKCELEEKLKIKLDIPSLLRTGSGDSNTADFGSMILRLPQTEIGLKRCKNNFNALKWLTRYPVPFEIPRPVIEGEFEGQAYFAEKKLQGISLDLYRVSRRNLRSIQEDALSFITCRDLIVTEEVSGEVFAETARSHIEKLLPFIKSSDLAIFEDLIAWMREIFTGLIIPLVIQHGDFKLSNFICSRKLRKRLTGIIDWDLSNNHGLPLVDLVSLAVYRDGKYSANAWELIAPDTRGRYRVDIELYLKRMHIDAALLRPLTLLTMIRIRNDFYYELWMKKDPAYYEIMITRSLIPACIQSMRNESHRNIG